MILNGSKKSRLSREKNTTLSDLVTLFARRPFDGNVRSLWGRTFPFFGFVGNDGVCSMKFETQADHYLVNASNSVLVSFFQSGDKEAFTEIDRRFRPRLLRFLRRRVDFQETAEDLTQETFLRAFKSLNTLRDGVFLPAWLKQIAYRVYVDWLRRVSKEVAVVFYDESASDVEDGTSKSSLAAFSISPKRPSGGEFSGTAFDETTILRDEKRNIWNIAREILSPTEFQTLWLRFEDELDDREIAKELGKSPGSVRVALSRAKKRLVTYLKDRNQD